MYEIQGLNKEQLVSLLKENGLGPQDELTKDNIIKAVSTAIDQNNKVVRKNISDQKDKFEMSLKGMGYKF